MPAMPKIFIGYDPRQAVSFTTLVASITKRASRPVSITPLVIEGLPLSRVGLTPFTYSRFLCPWLCDFSGYSLFMDVDMLVQGDICELMGLADNAHAVQVVKGSQRFEWASMMLFNNERCRKLTPAYVQDGKRLFEFTWADSVGALPSEWNYCVGYDQRSHVKPKLIHFTQGVPYFPETEGSEFSAEWRAELEAAIDSEPWEALMGQSVHAKRVRAR